MPGGQLQGQRTTEAHANDGRAVDPAAVEVGDEVVHVDRDVEGARVREAARAAATPVQGMDGDVAGPCDGGRQAVQLGGGRERAVEQEDLPRPGARHPPADGVAARPRELAGRLAREERADGIAAQLAAGGAGQGIEADEPRRDLEPGEEAADVGGERDVARIIGALEQDDGGLRDVPHVRVGDADDAGLRDGGVRGEHRLDLGRAHVLAAADDAVDPAIDDGQATLPVETAKVAGAERRVGGRGAGVLAQVPGEARGRLEDDLPHPGLVLVGEGEVDAGKRHARGPRLVPGVLGGERRGAGRHLRQAIRGNDRPSGPEGTGHEVGRDGAAAQQHRAQGRRRRGAASLVKRTRQLRRDQRDVAHGGARSVERGEEQQRVTSGDDTDRHPPRIARHTIPRPAT